MVLNNFRVQEGSYYMSNLLNTPKVFCIGFHKTGTTSLNASLTHLGYKVTGPDGVMDANIQNNVLAMCVNLSEKHDAFIDNPWPIFYKEMDKRYPNSKFILTVRPVNNWYISICKHFQETTTPMRQWIYGAGCPVGNEALYKKRFVRHYAEVEEYFSGRKEDLLIFNLVNGDGWDKLCRFLGKEIVTDNYPHLNKGNYESTS